MSDIVHLVSGDGAAGTLSGCGLPGQVVVFREALVAGPVKLLARDEWLDMRSAFLCSMSEDDVDTTRASLAAQEETLRDPSDHEIVLWFGRDVFCQVILAYVLHRAKESRCSNLSLVCPASTGTATAPCIGSLSPDDLAAQWPDRLPLTPALIDAGAAAFAAFAAADPRELEPHLASNALPGMSSALALHAERFPSIDDGLGRPGRCLLRALEDGDKSFGELFKHFIANEPGYGFADMQVWNELVGLAQGANPAIAPPITTTFEPKVTFSLTDDGRHIVRGAAEFSFPSTGWLGGVDLSKKSPPSFDADAAAFV